MKKLDRITKVILYAVFVVYIIVLLKLLLFSRFSLADLFNNKRVVERSINLIPFHSIWEFLVSGSANEKRFAFGNVVGNIVAFIPLGVYLPLFKKDKRLVANLVCVLIVSLLTEIIQGVFGIGTADIDDVILNCLGGLIGILVYKLINLFLHDDKKVRIAIAIPSVIIGLPILLYLLFIIKMRF